MFKRIYVENMSPWTTESKLKDLFMRVGPVYSVRILRYLDTGYPNGCAVVEIHIDAAEKAIAELNGMEIDGRTITVKDPTNLSGWLSQQKRAA